MNLVRSAKGDKKGFCKYVHSKRKTRGNVGLLLNGAVDLVTKGMEKAEVPSAFFALVFTNKTSLQQSQNPETRGEVWSKEDLPSG